MKAAFLFVFICCRHIVLFCQVVSSAEQQRFIAAVNAAASKYPATLHQSNNTKVPQAIKMPVDLLSNPGMLKQLLQQQPAKKDIVKNAPAGYSARPLSNTCADTSYRRLLDVPNGSIYLMSVTQTRDGGMLVPLLMHDTTLLPNPWWRSYGLLVKLDRDGNVTWLKQFEEINPGGFSYFTMNRAFELPNHDIIYTGLLDTTSGRSSYTTMVYRLNSSGNIIWQNRLKSQIALFARPVGSFRYDIETAVEGLNGDVILCGTSSTNLTSGFIETVTRLNSAGKVVWDINFGNHGVDGSYVFGAEGVAVFVKNGQISLVGLSHGSSNPQTAPAVNILTLDYSGGALVKKRFFRPEYQDLTESTIKSFGYYQNKCTQLSNGNYLFYGKLLSDIVNLKATKDHFGIIEFDPDFNLVSSYCISSSLQTNFYNNNLLFDASGRGLISLFEYLGSYEANIYFGAFQNKQFQKQRKAHYTNAGLPGNNGFAFLHDNGYAYLQSYFESLPVTKSFFEFRKMHNSDTSSQCLGNDTSLLQFLPFNIIEDADYYYLHPDDPNQLFEMAHITSQSDTMVVSSQDPCRQTNYCDTVKIHGNPVICGSSPSTVFTAFKNNACGAIAQWNIDRQAIDSLQVLNDSSVRIYFKNINWQGKLYASLPAGACYTSPQDSIFVSVVRMQSNISLGPDTVLCSGNNLVVHAGNRFSAYLWQDGSTDSLYNIRQPDTYYVRASDGCGNVFSDTIRVTPAVFYFSIGQDTLRCNKDTIRLNATPGFSNYQWYPAYNISAATGSSANIYPLADTFYCATAEKWPGCVVRDTIHIRVRNSPAILLGADTSVCTGQSLTLDAGFMNASYTWQDGSKQPQHLVTREGSYTVVVDLNGCTASDTIKISYIPKPIFTLGKDTELCTGQSIRLSPRVNATANYLWQDGSDLPAFNVHQPGLFSLTVSNTCGSFTDSIMIGEGLCILTMPNAFTPNGDGLNDIFKVKYLFGVKEFKLSIYNRYAEKIFETTDMQKGWDGTYKSVKQKTGSYIWVIRIKGLNDFIQTSSGTVIILR